MLGAGERWFLLARRLRRKCEGSVRSVVGAGLHAGVHMPNFYAKGDPRGLNAWTACRKLKARLKGEIKS